MSEILFLGGMLSKLGFYAETSNTATCFFLRIHNKSADDSFFIIYQEDC